MKQLLLTILLSIPLVFMAQDDDPFGGGGSGGDDPFGGGGGGSDDPFGDPAPQPTQPDVEPINQPQPDNQTNDNSSDDPFSSGDGNSASDPFGSGDSSDSAFGGSANTANNTGGGGSVFDNMVDTLTPPLVPEFPWEQKSIEERPILSSFDIRESDVFWAKTIWREIDVREKMNHPFAYPQAPFMTVLLDVLNKNPDIPVYKQDPFSGRDFSDVTKWDSIETSLGNARDITVYDYDDEGNEITRTETIVDQFRSAKVKRFAIKEVWYFDKKHSRMKVQIMGIAPLYEVNATDLDADAVLVQSLGLDQVSSYDVLFWVYYPDVREHLARYETMNPLNDAIRMSWDDLFTSRFFSSYITKVSNPLDESIKDYRTNKLDALYESEKVKEDIFNFEHDLWSY